MMRPNSSRTSTLSRKSEKSTPSVDRPTVTIPPLDSKVWDDIYELPRNDKETEEPHGSVIGHLLSQLKPGMDLTRVVLPTWILERRSLLEMFADFFVHPNVFIRMAHGPTPADRMIRCLRWYLSSFHAGRPSDIAKKPYNPIIGETFTCWIPPIDNSPKKDVKETVSEKVDAKSVSGVDNDDEAGAAAAAAAVQTDAGKTAAVKSATNTAAAIGGGPVPSVAGHNLTFIAEQVSHRPPVSCFYTESKKDRISMTAHVWTKSRFLGLSIGMECVGQGIIVLHDKGEEYVVTFPKAYGRSILTQPWFEMGGTCHINCEKTGYSAKIDFHEKPLIGGQKHRISAEVKAPNEKNPILKVEGHWNDKIYVIESEKKKKKEKESTTDLFVDTKSLPVVKKQTMPLDGQLETESRRQWREVTWCLKNNIVDGATHFKTSLEERQREGERNRQERGIKWTPKHFQEKQDGSYVYFSPLERRLRRD